MKNKTIGEIYGDHKAMGYYGRNAHLIGVRGHKPGTGGIYAICGPKMFERIKNITPEEFCTQGFRIPSVGSRNFDRISRALCIAGHYDRRTEARDRRSANGSKHSLTK